MNSRQRRRKEAIEHNENIELKHELMELRKAIYAKHRVSVFATYSCNESLRGEIERLKGIFKSEEPPKRKVKSNVTRLQPAAIAAMAGLGSV